MLSVRSFSLLCIATFCVVIAAALISGDSDAIPGSGKPLFPGLMSRLNEIEEVQVETSSQRFALKRGESGWMAPAKSGYPADGDKIHKLLLGAAGLSRVEPKTSEPGRYSRLGVEDPGAGDSPAKRYRLKSGGSDLVSLIVGNSAPAKGDPDLSEFYVRLPDEPRAWLVEGRLPRGDALVDWLDRTVADIDRARVQEASVLHASGEVVTVTRKSPGNDDFRLVDAPRTKSVDGQWKLNDIGRFFSDLKLEDVRPKGETPVDDAKPDYVVTMETFDGLVVRMQLFRRDGQALGILRAEARPGAASAEVSPQNQQPLRSADEVRSEADALNARWDRWAYVLPDFKLNALARTHAELLKDVSDEKQPDQG